MASRDRSRSQHRRRKPHDTYEADQRRYWQMRGYKFDACGTRLVPIRDAKLISLWETYFWLESDNSSTNDTIQERVWKKVNEEIQRGMVLMDHMTEEQIKEHMEKYLGETSTEQHRQPQATAGGG